MRPSFSDVSLSRFLFSLFRQQRLVSLTHMSSSATTAGGSSASAASRNASRLTATSSDHLSMAFIRRALTPKAVWTHKVRTSPTSCSDHLHLHTLSFPGRIPRCCLLASTDSRHSYRCDTRNFIRQGIRGHSYVRSLLADCIVTEKCSHECRRPLVALVSLVHCLSFSMQPTCNMSTQKSTVVLWKLSKKVL